MKPLHRAGAPGAAAVLVWVLGSSAAAVAEPGFVSPRAGDVLISGIAQEARWRSPSADGPDADEMELLLSVDGGATFPIRLTAELPPGAWAFRWRVPALSAARARLALRTGREGRPETERIAFVSGEFRIESSETSPAASLVRGPTEWWTEQALREIGAEGLLDEGLRDDSERLRAPDTDTELDEPPPGVSLTPHAGAARIRVSRPVFAARRPVPSPALRAPVPMRE